MRLRRRRGGSIRWGGRAADVDSMIFLINTTPALCATPPSEEGSLWVFCPPTSLDPRNPALGREPLKLQGIVTGNDPLSCTGQTFHAPEGRDVAFPVLWCKS